MSTYGRNTRDHLGKLRSKQPRIKKVFQVSVFNGNTSIVMLYQTSVASIWLDPKRVKHTSEIHFAQSPFGSKTTQCSPAILPVQVPFAALSSNASLNPDNAECVPLESMATHLSPIHVNGLWLPGRIARQHRCGSDTGAGFASDWWIYDSSVRKWLRNVDFRTVLTLDSLRLQKNQQQVIIELKVSQFVT